MVVPYVLALAFPPLTIEIAEGDITAQDVDAVVNAANTQFWMGAGMAGAIKARGGVEIEREAMLQGPVEPGQCVLTTGGRLVARHVIHAAVMGQDLRTSGAYIEQATRTALALADDRAFTSIALPAFGTGVGGFPLDECAHVMITAVRQQASGLTRLRLARFVLFGQQAYAAFERAARRILGREASAERPPLA